ncbi:hypothetical protein [Reyranella sp.]|uniref:hypothetical protein n=1 Tax=Reyranella sp. TaxID=1929291 RepID=UPI003D115CB3
MKNGHDLALPRDHYLQLLHMSGHLVRSFQHSTTFRSCQAFPPAAAGWMKEYIRQDDFRVSGSRLACESMNSFVDYHRGWADSLIWRNAALGGRAIVGA